MIISILFQFTFAFIFPNSHCLQSFWISSQYLSSFLKKLIINLPPFSFMFFVQLFSAFKNHILYFHAKYSVHFCIRLFAFWPASFHLLIQVNSLFFLLCWWKNDGCSQNMVGTLVLVCLSAIGFQILKTRSQNVVLRQAVKPTNVNDLFQMYKCV